MPVTWKTSFPVLNEIRLFSKTLAETIRSHIHEGAMVAGVSVLGHVQRDYETKSRHGTGEDGIQWKDLSPKTIEARVRRRANAQKIVEERRQLAAEIRGILHGGLTPRAKRGKGKAVSKEDAVRALREKREALSRKLDSMVIAEMSQYQIGVDQGLQRASAAPGFNDPAKTWRLNPPDDKGQNLFQVNGNTVTLGYSRSYSEAFDSERPIFPEQLPTSWKEDADEAVDDWMSGIAREIGGIN